MRVGILEGFGWMQRGKGSWALLGGGIVDISYTWDIPIFHSVTAGSCLYEHV